MSPFDEVARALVILGDGTFAIEALDVAEAMGGWRPVGFVNSVSRQAAGRQHADLPVFWVDDLPFGPDEVLLVAGLVSTKRRSLIETVSARGYRFATLAHPSAVISRRARLCPGAFIGAQAVVGANTTVGPHVVVNRGALIGHDDTLGAFCTLGPGVNVAGGVTVGEGAYLGVGAVVRDHVDIGAGAIVAAGAVVVGSVEPGVLVAGVPAKVIRRNVEAL